MKTLMKTGTLRSVKSITAIVVLLLLIAFMAGVFRKQIDPGTANIETQDYGDSVFATTESITRFEPVSASVEAKQTTIISSRVLARITKVHIRAGDSISENQLLIELENIDLAAKAKQTEEQVRVINARVTEAQKNLQRIQDLHSKQSVSDADLDKAKADSASLTAELAATQQALQAAQTAVSFTEIRSPITGRVVDHFAEQGDTASPGKALLSLYNPLALRVETRVREQLALSLTLNQKLGVKIPSLNKTVTGTIEEIVPAAERGSRSFLVKANIPYGNTLLPGMYAQVLIPAGKVEVVSIPSSYLAQIGQLEMVWVLADGTAAQRFVKTGNALKGSNAEAPRIEIISGLEEGEVVVIPVR